MALSASLRVYSCKGGPDLLHGCFSVFFCDVSQCRTQHSTATLVPFSIWSIAHENRATYLSVEENYSRAHTMMLVGVWLAWLVHTGSEAACEFSIKIGKSDGNLLCVILLYLLPSQSFIALLQLEAV